MSDSKNLELDPLTQDPLLDHEYDGIKELDNPLPGWWLATFYIFIVFWPIYTFTLHGLGKWTIRGEFEADLAQVNQAQQKQKGGDDQRNWAAWVNDTDRKAKGKVVWDGKCAVCHLADGGGSIGPNLTDSYWIHGDGQPESMWSTVYNGVPAKGMPAWGAVLKPEEVINVVVFANSLKGTKPAQPKAPQGDKVN